MSLPQIPDLVSICLIREGIIGRSRLSGFSFLGHLLRECKSPKGGGRVWVTCFGDLCASGGAHDWEKTSLVETRMIARVPLLLRTYAPAPMGKSGIVDQHNLMVGVGFK
jgi:hypothetical protein